MRKNDLPHEIQCCYENPVRTAQEHKTISLINRKKSHMKYQVAKSNSIKNTIKYCSSQNHKDSSTSVSLSHEFTISKTEKSQNDLTRYRKIVSQKV